METIKNKSIFFSDFRNIDWKNDGVYLLNLILLSITSFFIYYNFSKNTFGNSLSFNLLIFIFLLFYESKKKTKLIHNKLQFIGFLVFLIQVNTVTFIQFGIGNKKFLHFYLISPSILFLLHYFLDKAKATKREKLISFVLFTSSNSFFLGYFSYPILYVILGFLIFTELWNYPAHNANLNFLLIGFVSLYFVFHLFNVGLDPKNFMALFIIYGVLGLYFIVKNSNNTVNYFITYPILASFLIFLIFYSLNKSIIHISKNASGEFNTNRVGGYIASIFPWIIFMIVITFKKSKRYFYSLLFVFFFTLLVFITSNSRGAMFASTVIGLSFFLIFYLHRKFSFNTKNFILFMFMIPVALLGVLIFSWGQYISTSIDINSNNLNKFSSNRYELWTIASDAFSDLPVIYKLFGTGAFNKDILPLYINFSLSDILANIVQSSFGQYVHSHNLSIEILISFGVVGIFLFLLISIFIPAYNFYKSKKIHSLYYPSLATLLIILLHGSFDYLLDNVNNIFILPICLAFLNNPNEKLEQTLETPRKNPYYLFFIGLFFIVTIYYSQYYHSANKLLAKFSKLNMLSFHCPNTLASLEIVNSTNLETLVELEKEIKSNKLFLLAAENKYNTFYGSFNHALFLKTKNESYANQAEEWYGKCYRFHPYPKACENLRRQLYIDVGWDLKKLPNTKITNTNNRVVDLYSECRVK